MLKVHDLSRQFVRNGEKFLAVNAVNFHLKKGEMAVVIGQSGSGKSTLFHMIAGMIRATGGSVELMGKDITGISPSEFANLRGTVMGYIMQGQNLLQNLTVKENIYLPVSMNSKKEKKEKDIMRLLQRFGLEHLADEFPENLSGGEQRRVSIARAFVQEPELVIADEPTSNLDPENAKIIMESFKTLSDQGTTILVSTHNMDFVRYAHRCFEMAHGKLTEKR